MTQEQELALISSASLEQTQSILDLKIKLTQLVTDATVQFAKTIARVNALDKVDNIADLNKAISSFTQIEIDKKQDLLKSGGNISTINGVSLLSGLPLVIERSATSLHRIAYTDVSSLKTPSVPLPVEDDSVIVDGLGLFMYTKEINEPEDEETCFTAKHPVSKMPIGQWLLVIPSYEWISANSEIEKSIFREYMADRK